jgi:hypothetical protein
MKKVILATFFVIFFIQSFFSEIIILKNGTLIFGTIESVKNEVLRISSDTGNRYFFVGEIRYIFFDNSINLLNAKPGLNFFDGNFHIHKSLQLNNFENNQFLFLSEDGDSILLEKEYLNYLFVSDSSLEDKAEIMDSVIFFDNIVIDKEENTIINTSIGNLKINFNSLNFFKKTDDGYIIHFMNNSFIFSPNIYFNGYELKICQDQDFAIPFIKINSFYNLSQSLDFAIFDESYSKNYKIYTKNGVFFTNKFLKYDSEKIIIENNLKIYLDEIIGFEIPNVFFVQTKENFRASPLNNENNLFFIDQSSKIYNFDRKGFLTDFLDNNLFSLEYHLFDDHIFIQHYNDFIKLNLNTFEKTTLLKNTSGSHLITIKIENKLLIFQKTASTFRVYDIENNFFLKTKNLNSVFIKVFYGTNIYILSTNHFTILDSNLNVLKTIEIHNQFTNYPKINEFNEKVYFLELNNRIFSICPEGNILWEVYINDIFPNYSQQRIFDLVVDENDYLYIFIRNVLFKIKDGEVIKSTNINENYLFNKFKKNDINFNGSNLAILNEKYMFFILHDYLIGINSDFEIIYEKYLENINADYFEIKFIDNQYLAIYTDDGIRYLRIVF